MLLGREDICDSVGSQAKRMIQPMRAGPETQAFVKHQERIVECVCEVCVHEGLD